MPYAYAALHATGAVAEFPVPKVRLTVGCPSVWRFNLSRFDSRGSISAAKMASKMGAFLPAHHNNRGDPDHQNRTRPRTRYGLALCAGASPSVRANIK